MKIPLLTAVAFILHPSGVAAVSNAAASESMELHRQRNLDTPDKDAKDAESDAQVVQNEDLQKDTESEGQRSTTSNDMLAASPKLQVGTEPGGENVVRDFEVVPSWQQGDDLESQVPARSAATDFFLKVSGAPLQLTRASVKPESLPHVRNHLDGSLAKHLRLQGQANLKPGETHRLTVAYDCQHQGDVDLLLTLEFEGLSPVQIPWKKTCGGVQNKALTVTTGSGAEGEKVVIMGSPQWDELKVVGMQAIVTKFNIFVDPVSEQPEQQISKPQATASGACSVKVSSPVESKTKLQPGDSIFVSVTYVCHHHGKCAVAVEVPFHPSMAPYRPTRWQYTKLCGNSAPGIEVVGDPLGKKKQLVGSDGVHNNKTPEWLVSTNIENHQVRLLNDEALSQEPKIKVRSVRVRCLDTLRCTARIASSVPEFLMATEPTDVEVEYSCRTSGSSLVQFILFTENRQPVTATWAKDCSAWADSLWFILLLALLTSTCAAFACIGCVKFFVAKEELQTELPDEYEMEEGPDK